MIFRNAGINRPLVTRLIAVIALLAGARACHAGGLQGDYTDPAYLKQVPFGTHSHWLQSWRAYLETMPASTFIDGLGVHLDLAHLDGYPADAVVGMLARHGMKHARIEMGWGSWGYYYWDGRDETIMPQAGDNDFSPWLKACQKSGLRPLIVLNSHQGVPCPATFVYRTLTAAVQINGRRLQLDSTAGLVPGRSGICNLTDCWAAESIFLSLDGKSAGLSKPMPVSMPAGTLVKIATLKYRPFSVPGSQDYQDTMEGWKRYTGSVAAYCAKVLGTGKAADKGFDMEIWNEMSFGNHFLFINRYYKPALAAYPEDEISVALVKGTMDYVRLHPKLFSGVKFDDGFGNTLPWPAASTEPGGIAAIGKHPYIQAHSFPGDLKGGKAVDADGRATDFVPEYEEFLPEYFATPLQTEMALRDMAPFNEEYGGAVHGRLAGKSGPMPVWITELGILPAERGVTGTTAALALKAKCLPRFAAFYLNKGVTRLYFYSAAEDPDAGLALLSKKFLEFARAGGIVPADDSAWVSPALAALDRMASKMKEGIDRGLTRTRALKVLSIQDTHDHFQFEGGGKSSLPSLYDREVFAFLPFQVNSGRFVIPYYVATRNALKDFKPEAFTVGISGIDGLKTSVSAYDPIKDRAVPVAVSGRKAGSMEVSLWASDAPWMLILQEGSAALPSGEAPLPAL